MAISSTTSTDWPQQIDETRGTIASNNSRGMMEKTSQDHQQAQQTLKCPRCDSSNTKFCYYNNYSLSQPRHFCKACKRYWTRGGTLRNVPVGGGYRKNKRVIKKPAAAVITTASSNPRVQSNLPSTHNHQMNVSSGSNQMNPLFYGLPNTTSYINHLPFSSSYTSPYDHQSQLGNMGLNYSTSDSNNYGSAGFNPSSTDQVQDLINSSNSQLSSSRFSLFGSSCSTLNMTNDPKSTSYLQGLLPFQDLQMGVSNEDNKTQMMMNKEMKMEEGNNNQIDGDKSTSKVVEWNLPSQNMVGSTDSTMYWNSNMSVGAWPDLTNTYGSSVTSLI